MPFYALVTFHNFFRINGKLFIRINDYTKQAGICLEERLEEKYE